MQKDETWMTWRIYQASSTFVDSFFGRLVKLSLAFREKKFKQSFFFLFGRWRLCLKPTTIHLSR